jgi:hypothetical protein
MRYPKISHHIMKILEDGCHGSPSFGFSAVTGQQLVSFFPFVSCHSLFHFMLISLQQLYPLMLTFTLIDPFFRSEKLIIFKINVLSLRVWISSLYSSCVIMFLLALFFIFLSFFFLVHLLKESTEQVRNCLFCRSDKSPMYQQ